ERAITFFKSQADVSSGNWNGLVVHGHQRIFKCAVIEGKRTLKESLAGKSDETETAMRVTPHKVGDREFGSLKSAGSNVSSQHAPGTIENENNVFAKRLTGFFLLTPLGPGECESDAGNCQH